MTRQEARTPDDARYRPQVGDVSTATDDGTTLTVTEVSDAGWLSVCRVLPDGTTTDPYSVLHKAGWAYDDGGVWTWTPGGVR